MNATAGRVQKARAAEYIESPRRPVTQVLEWPLSFRHDLPDPEPVGGCRRNRGRRSTCFSRKARKDIVPGRSSTGNWAATVIEAQAMFGDIGQERAGERFRVLRKRRARRSEGHRFDSIIWPGFTILELLEFAINEKVANPGPRGDHRCPIVWWGRRSQLTMRPAPEHRN